jgi:hypothetical protein
MSGWFSGNTSRKHSIVFSCSTRASWYRPSSLYVPARLPIAAPRTDRVISFVRHEINNHNHSTPISGWFSGSTRRRNSSVFSCSTRASRCRPSALKVAARLFIAAPLTEGVKSHVKSTNTITSHLCPDGFPAAHAAETRAPSRTAPEHLGAARVHRKCRQDCS